MNKVILVLLATVLALGFSENASAADGNVSDGVLADMGLSGVQSMTDAQGDEIRGKGFASVWGYSFAFGPIKPYYSQSPPSFVANGSVSFSFGASAGGYSSAYAF